MLKKLFNRLNKKVSDAKESGKGKSNIDIFENKENASQHISSTEYPLWSLESDFATKEEMQDIEKFIVKENEKATIDKFGSKTVDYIDKLYHSSHNSPLLTETDLKKAIKDLQKSLEDIKKEREEDQNKVRAVLTPGKLVKLCNPKKLSAHVNDETCLTDIPSYNPLKQDSDVYTPVTSWPNTGSYNSGAIADLEEGDVLMFVGWAKDKQTKIEDPIWLWGDKKYQGWLRRDDFVLIDTQPSKDTHIDEQ